MMRTPLLLLCGLALPLALAACGPAMQGGLAPGLTQRLDQPGARLDHASALSIINAYRQSVGAAPLSLDPALNDHAARLASDYARSGNAPVTPATASAMRVSAGYTTFADTFSGWRNSPADAGVLARATAHRAGIGVVNAPASTYGVHWVLLLAD